MSSHSPDSEHIPFVDKGHCIISALVLLCINQHTKFEVPSFTNSKYIIEANNKNEPRDPDHAHWG